MCRSYYGCISGRFWFGCQSSAQLFDLGAIEMSQNFSFKGCGCHIDIIDVHTKCYCEDCYDSYEEHIKEVQKDEDDEEASEYCFSCDTYNWMIRRDVFEDQCVPHINKHEALFNKYIETITFDEKSDYAYQITLTDKKYASGVNEDRTLADLCFMKQVHEYFNKNPDEDICSWEAEY